MASSGYSTRSVAPWQPSKRDPEVHTEKYTIDLADLAGRPTRTLHLYCSAQDGRWRWHITPYKRHEAMLMSRHEGYTRPHLAERALMFALHRHLHPKK